MIEALKSSRSSKWERLTGWQADPEQYRRFRKRAAWYDKAARWVISASGIGIIAAILGIGVFLFSVVIPLLWGAEINATFNGSTDIAQARHIFSDEEKKQIGIIGSEPWLEVRSADRDSTGVKPAEMMPIPGLEGQRITVAEGQAGTPLVALATANGMVWVGKAEFATSYDGTEKQVQPRFEEIVKLDLLPGGSIDDVSLFFGDSGGKVAVLYGAEVVLAKITQRKPLIGPVVTNTEQAQIDLSDLQGEPTQILISDNSSQLYVATDAGFIGRWNLADFPNLTLNEQVPVTEGAGVSVLEALLGNRSLIIGGTDGSVAGWSLVESDEIADGSALAQLHELKAHQAAVSQIAVSPRDKSLITIDEDGVLKLQHMTTHRLLKQIRLDAVPQAISFSPKANGLVSAAAGNLKVWSVHNPHPDVSLGTLFTKVWYEGHNEPKHIWQSHGATDDFEPKFGLMPLVFGTLKGTFYAMLFSIPIAVIGALYTSQFLDKRLRGPVKSAIEVMAALPSVVLGFIAGLVLAPLVETHVVGVMLLGLVVPLAAIFGMWFLYSNPLKPIRVLTRAHQFLALLVCLVFGVWLSFQLGGPVEAALFNGDFQGWLYQNLGMRYDQRNSLVVGIIMGFAVIPIIFTICEDAFSSVPAHLVAASLACGATPWQTAFQVILPAAGSGVFSALMVGFGRAIGETMIVLMATGNTPIMDGSLFNGFRALSANIAVEIPEAPIGGTHYRILFLTALLLFFMTFFVNTVAEIIRARLRDQLSGV